MYIRRVKLIVLMRHAKAEPGVPEQDDFSRVLAGRGKEDAERMGKALAKLDDVPDAIVTSSAARAKETAELAARGMKFRGTIKEDRSLYGADGEAWLAALRKLPASADTALVVGHAPGIDEAAGLLTGAPARAFDVPTAGVLAFEADVDEWRALEAGDGALLWFLRPKMLGAL